MTRPLYHYLKSENNRTFISLYDKYRKESRYLSTEVEFNNFRIEVPDTLSFIFQYKDYFVDDTLRFKSSSDTPLIFDCGSNVGTTCLYLKWIFPNSKIKAFEPDPYIFRYLSKNIKRNNLEDVELFNKAIWINDEDLEFSQEGADAGSLYGSNSKIKVKAVRLKNLLAEESKVDLLKMDIEGAEIDVILDCDGSLECVDRLFIEYHGWGNVPQRLQDILAVLSRSGFRYHMHSLRNRKQPLVETGCTEEIDMQTNVFAWR